jgi:hypothetical protein
MTHTRTLTFACAVVAMLGAPLLQDSAEAQGRRGGDRQATGGRDGGRGGGRAEPANRGNGRRVAPGRRSGNRGVVGPRRTGRIGAQPRRGGVVIGAYYRPLYYSSFYSPYYNGFYDPYYYSRYSSYYGGYSAYGSGQIYRPDSSLRLQVSPRTTEVFVDGYYAGTVDEYDGIFQRLRLEPGEYEMALYLPGYRTVTQRVLMQPDRTLKIKHEMVPLGPSDSPEPRPAATGEPSLRGLSAADSGPQNRDASFGAIAVRVQPADADVLIDGERWEGPSNDEALVLDIAPGTHRVEVRKDGYRGYATQIDVQAGETAPINVSLPRE